MFDPNPHAIPCNPGQSREEKTAYKCGICKTLQPRATTDRTLVMRLGQRFDSARRLSYFVSVRRPFPTPDESLGVGAEGLRQ
jgi:hypothetical protein